MNVGLFFYTVIHQFDIDTCFAVPGDYIQPFMNSLLDTKKIHMISVTTEQIATMSAIGYALNHPSCIGIAIHTFCVGTYTGFNGIHISFAEKVTTLHFIGIPPRNYLKNKKVTHHSHGENTINRFLKSIEPMFLKVYHVHENFNCQHLFRDLNNLHGPIALLIPMDLTHINTSIFYKYISPINHDLPIIMKKAMEKALRPILFVGKQSRYLVNEIKLLINNWKAAYVVFIDAISYIDPLHKSFHGIYLPLTNEKIHSDCIVFIGASLDDYTTLGYRIPSPDVVLTLDEMIYRGVNYKIRNIKKLMFDFSKLSFQNLQYPTFKNKCFFKQTIHSLLLDDCKITQDTLADTIQHFLKDANIKLYFDTGTCWGIMCRLSFQYNQQCECAVLSSSIGYSGGISLGVCISSRQKNIFIIGDGAFMEISTVISDHFRYNQHPIFLLLQNERYQIENIILKKAPYNDLCLWDYKKLLESFGGPFYFSIVNTVKECHKNIKKAINSDRLSFIVVRLDKDDYVKRPSFKQMLYQITHPIQSNYPSLGL